MIKFFLIFSFILLSQSRAEPPILRISMESEPTTLDWHEAHYSNERFILSFLMRGIMKNDSSGQPMCDLCSSYETSGDFKTWKFHFKDNIVWSDGIPFEANQIIESYKRLTHSGNSFASAGIFSVIASMNSSNSLDLEIKLKEKLSTFGYLLTQPAIFPIRREFAKDLSAGPTLGPYILAAWEKGKRVVLEGNPKYPGERPVYRVEFRLGKRSDLFQSFKTNKLDVLVQPTTEEVLKSPSKNIQVLPYWATRSLVFNSKKISDSSYRRAILFSLDRKELPAQLKSGDKAATSIIPVGTYGARDLPLVTQDFEKAKLELNRSSITNKKWTFIAQDSSAHRLTADWLRASVKKIGIELKFEFYSANKFQSVIDKGNFDAAIMDETLTTGNSLEMLKKFTSFQKGGASGWSQVGFDALFTQMSSGISGPELKNQIEKAINILEVEEAVVIPLTYPVQAYLLGGRVKNFSATPFGNPDLIKINVQ